MGMLIGNAQMSQVMKGKLRKLTNDQGRSDRSTNSENVEQFHAYGFEDLVMRKECS
jgi:hypothetical protein